MLQSEDPTGIRKGTATQEPKADGSQLVNRAVSLFTRCTSACNVKLTCPNCHVSWQVLHHQSLSANFLKEFRTGLGSRS